MTSLAYPVDLRPESPPICFGRESAVPVGTDVQSIEGTDLVIPRISQEEYRLKLQMAYARIKGAFSRENKSEHRCPICRGLVSDVTPTLHLPEAEEKARRHEYRCERCGSRSGFAPSVSSHPSGLSRAQRRARGWR